MVAKWRYCHSREIECHVKGQRESDQYWEKQKGSLDEGFDHKFKHQDKNPCNIKNRRCYSHYICCETLSMCMCYLHQIDIVADIL